MLLLSCFHTNIVKPEPSTIILLSPLPAKKREPKNQFSVDCRVDPPVRGWPPGQPPCAGPPILARLPHQSRPYRIQFYVPPDPLKLPFVADQPVVTLLPPERACKAKHLIRSARTNPFQRSGQLWNCDSRSDQQMRV